jgi:hypothetical protein
MFDVSTALTTLLRTRERNLLYVFEFYRYDYEPFPEPASGNLSFDPRHAVKLFAGQPISFDLDGDTVTYVRQVVEAPSVNKHISKQFDTATIKLSNVDRTTAAWVLSETIQGMRMVIRLMPADAPISVTPGSASAYFDSIILFVGRVNKPGDFNRSTGTISATQDLGTIEAQIPPRQFQPSCPLKFKGAECLGSETLDQKSATYKAAKICNKSFAQCTDYTNTEFFQGVRIIQIESSFVHKSNESFFKKILNILPGISRKKTVVGNSIHDGTPYGQVIPIVLGRWLMRLIPLQFQDIGTSINFKMAACRGTIHDFLNIRNESLGFTAPHDITEHYGEYGGVGSQTADTVFPDASFHSKLAYITGQCDGSDIATEEPAPLISAMIAGQKLRLAFGTVNDGRASVSSVLAGYTSGGASYDAWGDNPVDLARYVITEPSLLNVPTTHIAERATVRTASYTIGPIKDLSNAERCLLPDTETARAGVDYKRYTSTGMIGGRSFRVGAAVPQQPNGVPSREAEYEFFDPDAPPSSLAVKTIYRKRYTGNIEINEQKKAIDFLYDTLLPSFRGFIRWDHLGRLAIDCDRPAEHTQLRANSVTGATTILVRDVLPWKPLTVILNEPEPLRGKVRIGGGILNNELTSEVRSVSSSAYSADGNAITLDASATGGLTATPSGANLTGGSPTVAASGEIEVGGTPADGDTLSAIINGVTVTVTATAEDEITQIPDNLSMAEQLVYAINAEPSLQPYIFAERGLAGGFTTIVTIYAKYGVLTLSSALEENHYAELDDPTVAPTLAAAAGSLAAGAYLVAYAYRNANGNTNLSPITAVTLTASQQIDVTAITPLPAGVDSVDWFVSVEANSGTMLLVANNNGSAFSINSLPESTDADPPKINTTGEELTRVMMSFAGKALTYADTTKANILDGSFSWPEGRRQSTINQVKTKYREAIQDFGEQPLIINDERHQEIIGKTNSVDIDLSAVDNFNQASRLCNGYLAKVRDADFFFSWGSAGEALLLEVGDVVCASDDSGAWRNVPIRIEEVTYNNQFQVFFTGRLYSSSQFDDTVLQTDVPLPSALANFKSTPPDISFNTVDFPPGGLVQSTDGTAGITSIRGGAIVGDSVYPQLITVRVIQRAGVAVNETVLSNATPDANGELVFEFPASAEGLYEVELEVCNQWGCNTTKPTATITITFASLENVVVNDVLVAVNSIQVTQTI